MTEESVQGSGIFGRFLQPHTDEFYLLFRLAFAVLLGLHGAQKAFLLWDFPAGANPNGMGALVDLAGWVELISAFLIGLGILTRLGAGAMVVTMIVAYFGVHAPPQSGLALATSVPQSSRRGQCVRGARWRGSDPVLPLCCHHRCPWESQVGY